MADVEPLPFVPAIWTVRIFLCGSPSSDSSFSILAKLNVARKPEEPAVPETKPADVPQAEPAQPETEPAKPDQTTEEEGK